MKEVPLGGTSFMLDWMDLKRLLAADESAHHKIHTQELAQSMDRRE